MWGVCEGGGVRVGGVSVGCVCEAVGGVRVRGTCLLQRDLEEDSSANGGRTWASVCGPGQVAEEGQVAGGDGAQGSGGRTQLPLRPGVGAAVRLGAG